MKRPFLAVTSLAILTGSLQAQPALVGDGVRFFYPGSATHSVALVGDFNGWAKNEDLLEKDSSGGWTIVKQLSPGVFQYKFLIDGETYELDPANPATVENYNRTSLNSVFVITSDLDLELASVSQQPASNLQDKYPEVQGKKPIYLNIIWHQHQPLYVDPEADQLKGPWVRTHATKDYYDMAAMLEHYPNVHCNINLTSSLLHQLTMFYLDRLGPFVNVRNNSIDSDAFLERWRGKTDPWIDLALMPTNSFGEEEKNLIYRNAWNAFGISEVMIERFPEYARLKQKLDVDQLPGYDLLTEQEMREAKFWFYLAHFDPDFLRGPVKLTDGTVCDLSDLVERRTGKYYVRRPVTEHDCNRMVVEAYKVMANVLPAHKSLLYDDTSRTGQIEIITTPFYHPILPLIYDSDLARIGQPNDPLSRRFSYPEDAWAQVAKAVKMYEKLLGVKPKGMWPGEGSVAQPVLEILAKNGLLWTASDGKVLQRSRPKDQPNNSPYRFPARRVVDDSLRGDGLPGSWTEKELRPGEEQWIALVFRNTELSDRIGFKYQTYGPEEAAEDFVQEILRRRPRSDEPDVLITVILDGENAWEWYRKDEDGKGFLNALYRKLSKLYERRQVITTTTSEYLKGNPARGIPEHPIGKLPEMEWLYPGSWINASFDTWIGEQEENQAWEYLLQTREDLALTRILQPVPSSDLPIGGTKEFYEYMAWEEMYAAEGSDWFWWYGNDQTAPAGDRPFDEGFRTHLQNVYKFARLAGADMPLRRFEPIIGATRQKGGGGGTMARGANELQKVLFTCDASTQSLVSSVFIVGELEVLGAWVPNRVRMYDDGTHGDEQAGDGIWSLELEVPIGMEIRYKYTNSGKEGEWVPGEEFPVQNRVLRLTEPSDQQLVVRDIFGRFDDQ